MKIDLDPIEIRLATQEDDIRSLTSLMLFGDFGSNYSGNNSIQTAFADERLSLA
jgi:hypothetical protein